MGGVRSRKYGASISDMTTTWGLRREVVLHINLPRASIEPGECCDTSQGMVHVAGYVIGGEGLCLERGQFSSHHKSGNKIWQFKQWYIWTATIPLQTIAIWGAYYLARIPVHIVLLNEGYHYQTQTFIWGKNRLSTYNVGVQWPWQIPGAISPPPSWVSYPHSVCYGVSVLILVLLLSFSPYTVLVPGQNLLRRCCTPMNQSSVNMITTDDENYLSFQFWAN